MSHTRVPTCIEKCGSRFRLTVAEAIAQVTAEVLARWADHPALAACSEAETLTQAIAALSPVWSTHFHDGRAALDPLHWTMAGWNSPSGSQPSHGIGVYIPGQCDRCGPVLYVSWEYIARSIRGDRETTIHRRAESAEQLTFLGVGYGT